MTEDEYHSLTSKTEFGGSETVKCACGWSINVESIHHAIVAGRDHLKAFEDDTKN